MVKEEFYSKKRLYHYTSIQTACKILNSSQLKFGQLCGMNDINESGRFVAYPANSNNDASELPILQEWAKHRQISFTEDRGKRLGFDIPAMWGHYADRGQGVCLVFDKEQLLSCLSQDMYQGSIQYGKYRGVIQCDDANVVRFFKKHHKSLFFKKTQDWRYEQEYRIVARTEKSAEDYLFLPFAPSCLMAVIVCHAIPDTMCDVGGVPILIYDNWFDEPVLKDQAGESWIREKELILDV